MSSNQDTPQAKFYTYAHFRADDGKCFYIGKGKGKRAWSTRRSQFWKNVANKHGYHVQILATWESEEDAFEHEKLLIACFRDMGHPLVNLTDGGEGASGLVCSEKTRSIRRENAIIRWSNQDFYQEMSEQAHRRMSSPERRGIMSEQSKKWWSDPGFRARFSGESSPAAKLSDYACRQVFYLRAQGLSQRKIAAQIGCTQTQVQNILSGKQRRNVYLEFNPDES